MVIVPDSDIILIKSPLKLDNSNQITFASAQAQETYFKSLAHLEYDGCTYQRKDNVIRYATNNAIKFENLITYNYCMYKNDSYSNKWFYAFITNCEYINDGLTEVSIETDAFQTWQFDIQYMNSYIEREHVGDDTIGLHTIPENIDTGDFISCKLQPELSSNIETCFVLAVTDLNGMFGGYTFVNQSIPIGLYYIGLTNLGDIQKIIREYDSAGKGEAINSVFVIPKGFFSNWQSLGTGYSGNFSTTLNFEFSENIQITRTNYLGNDYIPKNNKLLTYPYSYLQVSNHTGQVVNYKWENFNMLPVGTSGYNFTLKGTITPGGSFKLFPTNYNNILTNRDDTITLGKYPIGAYTNDVYTNWLTQNGVNLGFTTLNAKDAGLVSGAIQTTTGIAELVAGLYGAGATQTMSGIGQIIGTLQNDYRHSMIPDSVSGNLNTGDVNFVFGLNTLEFKRMSIKNEYAEIIDNFFSMYGYKVNRLTTPNIHKRLNWDYIKTIDVNLEGNIPEKDLTTIRNLFNNGCTFWHNTNTFLNYSASNTII